MVDEDLMAWPDFSSWEIEFWHSGRPLFETLGAAFLQDNFPTVIDEQLSAEQNINSARRLIMTKYVQPWTTCD